MKILLLCMVSVLFRDAIAQAKLEIKPSLAFPGIAVNSVQLIVRADINNKLFYNSFHLPSPGRPRPATVVNNFMKQPLVQYWQKEFIKTRQYNPGNNTLNLISEVAGGVLDIFLGQYSVQNKITH